jgi:hypothetical protein
LVDSHTKTDTYTYILELDAAGKIIGGEYTDRSKRFHADFLWVPHATPSDSGKLEYDKLKMLNEKAAK